MGFEDRRRVLRRRCGGHDELSAFWGQGPGSAPTPHGFGDLLQLTATSITKASARRGRYRNRDRGTLG